MSLSTVYREKQFPMLKMQIHIWHQLEKKLYLNRVDQLSITVMVNGQSKDMQYMSGMH